MNKWFKQIGVVIALMFSVMTFAHASGSGEESLTVQDGNAQLWAQLKDGVEGRTTSTSEFHAQPINTYDLRVFQLRSDLLAPALLASFFGMIIIFLLFMKINGIAKLHGGFTGKMVYRWSKFDVSIHWLGAIPCMLLILTGMVLLAGRYFFQPYISEGMWSSLVYIAKEVHDYMAIPFMLGWALMSVLWAKTQLPKMYDLKWMLVVGGYINFGPFKGKHPDAGFANAGEKLWFWAFALFGLFISVSGMLLLFPNLFEPSRNLSLLALVVHSVSAIIICAFSIVHIFMATAMSEGGMDCMVSGYCDEQWAKQHHNLWYDEIKEKGELKYRD
ncbi:formate dehydrogenase subunit gamma [Shewanella japonica]|uniref:formate dehydrogenase subunit gamma n=1 Tax=Shewanella japonica TaxID=93973 RepID=UPI0024942B86|nr:formate dehydrogenase subunit gamma [Shewanella japonica]